MRSLILFVLFLGIISCQKSVEAPQTKSATTSIPEDFMQFYRSFHGDSLYQVGHINFPLEGLPSYAKEEDLKDGKFYWEKSDWRFQRSIDFEFSDFERILMPINEFIIEETILHKKDKLAIQRKYVKFGEDWNLIYYSGLNPYTLND